jgi:hypothetical protein
MLKVLAPAVVEALNRAGEAGADAVQTGIMTILNRPTPLTLKGGGVMKALIRTECGDPCVLIAPQ